MKTVSIIFPAYKAKALTKVIEEYKNFFKNKIKTEMIVVIDEPKEKVIKELKKLKVKVIAFKKRKGKGNAIITGFNIAKGDVIGFVDSDGSIAPKDAWRIIQAAYKKGVAIGIRKQPRYKSLVRNITSAAFNLYVSLILGIKIEDIQCGAKFFGKEIIEKIKDKLRIKGFAIDVEIMSLIKDTDKNDIEKVYIAFNNKSPTTIKPIHIVNMALDVLRIALKLK